MLRSKRRGTKSKHGTVMYNEKLNAEPGLACRDLLQMRSRTVVAGVARFTQSLRCGVRKPILAA
jgi:hypothetical protein